LLLSADGCCGCCAVAAPLQALSYSQGSKTRYLVRLQLHEPASASLRALLQLKEGKAAAAAAAAHAALADTMSDQAEHKPHAAAGSSHGSSESGAVREDHVGSLPDMKGMHQKEQEPR
jgi:hypothetical protein